MDEQHLVIWPGRECRATRSGRHIGVWRPVADGMVDQVAIAMATFHCEACELVMSVAISHHGGGQTSDGFIQTEGV